MAVTLNSAPLEPVSPLGVFDNRVAAIVRFQGFIECFSAAGKAVRAWVLRRGPGRLLRPGRRIARRPASAARCHPQTRPFGQLGASYLAGYGQNVRSMGGRGGRQNPRATPQSRDVAGKGARNLSRSGMLAAVICNE